MGWRSQSVDGSVVFVTGGASGIGLALGAEMARRGGRVVLADVDVSPLTSASDRLRTEGLRVTATPLEMLEDSFVDGKEEQWNRTPSTAE